MNRCCPEDLIIISMRMRGHAGASGYDRLADFVHGAVIHPVKDWTMPRRAVARALRFLNERSGSVWYHRDSLLSELQAAKRWVHRRGQVFHFLYGENSYRYLGILRQAGHRNAIVATYHLPPDGFRKIVQDLNHLKRLDAAIVVAASQLGLFSELLGPDRVFFVPHGVDVDYFRPGEPPGEQEGGFRCLFVGSHLRDFATLARAADLLQSRDRDVRFTVVTRSSLHHHFNGLNNVELLAGITDRRLLQLYQESHALVLPLLSGTANNTLLEGMACGLPIVTTDMPAVRDYVDADQGILTARGNAEEIAEAVMALKADGEALGRMGRQCRLRALELSWENVARRMCEIYALVSP